MTNVSIICLLACRYMGVSIMEMHKMTNVKIIKYGRVYYSDNQENLESSQMDEIHQVEIQKCYNNERLNINPKIQCSVHFINTKHS